MGIESDNTDASAGRSSTYALTLPDPAPAFLTLADVLGYAPPTSRRWFLLEPEQWLHAMRQPRPHGVLDRFGALVEATYARSTWRDFVRARQEWTLVATRLCSEDPDEDDAYDMVGTGVCICGQTGLSKLYLLHNAATGYVMVVGSHCVSNLAGREDTITATEALEAFLASERTRLRAPGIALACEYDWIDERTQDFLMSIQRKRKLSRKQVDWERDIRGRLACRRHFCGLPVAPRE
jgi:hypothetical protein